MVIPDDLLFRRCCYFIASFPGSPHMWTKNLKERGKMYHMRNFNGRENLITCGQTNELPTLCWQNILAQSWKLYGWQDGTRQHYNTSSGSTASYGELTQTCTVHYANMGTSTIRLCSISPLYLLSTLYVIHVIKYSRPCNGFQMMESWAEPGNEASYFIISNWELTFGGRGRLVYRFWLMA